MQIKDVAKHAGVGVGTVSRVINNEPNVSAKTRQKVEKSIQILGYHPNPVARAFKKNTTEFIGMIIPRCDLPFFGKLLYHTEQELVAHRYKLLLCNSAQDSSKELEYLKMLQQNRVEGIFLATDFISHKNLDQKLPIVCFDRAINDTPYVASDNFKGGVLAASHFGETRCKKAVFLSLVLNESLETSEGERRKGFLETCEKEGILGFSHQKIAGFEAEHELACEFFERFPDADGVFTSSDSIALAVYSEAQKRGISVPKQLQIIGYDGMYSNSLSFPQISSIVQPLEEMVCGMVQLLRSSIEKKTTGQTRLIYDVKLFLGTTTKNK